MQSEVEKLISALPNKTSSRHDQVSNKILKDLGNTISFPLSLIFNQSLESGVFPDLMKVAKVIPLYKGQDQDQLINYHPISLLMTIYKLLEKIVCSKVYTSWKKISYSMKANSGFEVIILVNMQFLN